MVPIDPKAKERRYADRFREYLLGDGQIDARERVLLADMAEILGLKARVVAQIEGSIAQEPEVVAVVVRFQEQAATAAMVVVEEPKRPLDLRLDKREVLSAETDLEARRAISRNRSVLDDGEQVISTAEPEPLGSHLPLERFDPGEPSAELQCKNWAARAWGRVEKMPAWAAVGICLLVVCIFFYAMGRASTGTRFQVEEGGSTVRDAQTGLTWQRAAGDNTLTQDQGKQLCSASPLPGGPWRVPTHEELKVLMDNNRLPMIDTDVFQMGETARDWSYWAADFSEGRGWTVYFFPSGHSSYGGVANGSHIRCVH